MSGVDGTRAWPSFRIDLALTDADILAFQQVVLAKQRGRGASRLCWSVIAASFALALAGGWLMTQAGISRASDEGLVSVIIFAVFWLGIWTPSMWSRQRRRLLLHDGQADIRARMKGAVVLVSPRGIVIRLADARGFHRCSAVKAATLERGLVVLWAAPETARTIVCVPVRLLEPWQKDRLLSFGREGEMIK